MSVPFLQIFSIFFDLCHTEMSATLSAGKDVERFMRLRSAAFTDPKSFHRYSSLSEDAGFAITQAFGTISISLTCTRTSCRPGHARFCPAQGAGSPHRACGVEETLRLRVHPPQHQIDPAAVSLAGCSGKSGQRHGRRPGICRIKAPHPRFCSLKGVPRRIAGFADTHVSPSEIGAPRL